MDMKELRITFKTANLAKEKGFNWLTLYAYGAGNELSDMDGEYFEERDFNLLKQSEYWSISAPTQSLLQKWLREVHNIHVTSHCKNTKNSIGTYVSVVEVNNETEHYHYGHDTYEEALKIGLQKALKLIK